jgi:hypothetical protein
MTVMTTHDYESRNKLGFALTSAQLTQYLSAQKILLVQQLCGMLSYQVMQPCNLVHCGTTSAVPATIHIQIRAIKGS